MARRSRSPSVSEARFKRHIHADPDNPELTQKELAELKPFREALPDLAAAMDREIAKRGRPRLEHPKEAVTLRLDPATVAKFKATGSNWRALMGKALDKAKV